MVAGSERGVVDDVVVVGIKGKLGEKINVTF